MRDDVELIINDLIRLFAEKRAAFDDFYAGEIKKKYLLQSGNLDPLLESFAHDSDFMAAVDIIDFNITARFERLAAIIGIPLADVNRHLRELRSLSKSKEDKDLLFQLFTARHDLNTTVKNCYAARERVIALLKEQAIEVETAMNELAAIQIFEFEDL